MNRLTLLPDFLEERWPSMDLCAEQLYHHLQEMDLNRWQFDMTWPRYNRRFQRLPFLGKKKISYTMDRLLNRFYDYIKQIKVDRSPAHFFHIVDQTYAHLANVLPPGNVGVYCHDLDVFRCLLQPDVEPRPRWFKRQIQKVLRGFQSCSIVFYSTQQIYDQILKYQLIDSNRLVYAPYGFSAEFTPEPTELDIRHRATPYMLHVSSCIPRKNIELLLQLFAKIHLLFPDLLLIQIGGEFTPSQRDFLTSNSLHTHVYQFRNLSRAELAAFYRQAKLCISTSRAEGFGLPILEALACGTRMIASDIPAFREVSAGVIPLIDSQDPATWVRVLDTMLKSADTVEERRRRIERAQQFSWRQHSQIIFSAYERLLQDCSPCMSSI